MKVEHDARRRFYEPKWSFAHYQNGFFIRLQCGGACQDDIFRILDADEYTAAIMARNNKKAPND